MYLNLLNFQLIVYVGFIILRIITEILLVLSIYFFLIDEVDEVDGKVKNDRSKNLAISTVFFGLLTFIYAIAFKPKFFMY